MEISTNFEDLTQLLDDIQLQASTNSTPQELLTDKSGCLGYACALFDCDGQGIDELSLKQGDTVKILAKDDSGWWAGERNGRIGLFPANYVEEIEHLDYL